MNQYQTCGAICSHTIHLFHCNGLCKCPQTIKREADHWLIKQSGPLRQISQSFTRQVQYLHFSNEAFLSQFNGQLRKLHSGQGFVNVTAEIVGCLFFIMSDGLFAPYIAVYAAVVHGRVERQRQIIHTEGRQQDLFT